MWALAAKTPTGFLPEDDQGAFFVVVQLPGGASLNRTNEVVRQAETILKEEEAVADYHLGRRPELHRHLFAAERRLHGGDAQALRGAAGRMTTRPTALIKRLGQKFAGIPGGTVVALAPPPIIGLGTGGGFTYVRQGHARRRSRKSWRRSCAA